MTQADVITKQFMKKNMKKLLELEDPCHPERLCNMLLQTRQLGKVFNLWMTWSMTVKKVEEIDYYIALKEQPFLTFKNIEKMHGVKYSGAYGNDKPCKKFIFGVTEYVFEENIKNKSAPVNFLAVLCDGLTDKNIAEQELVYVIFTDPETHFPALIFFHVVAPTVNQDAPGLKQTIADSFKENLLESTFEKFAF